LVYLYDDNKITIDGPTSLSFSEDVAKRFDAYRWHVQAIDGQDWETTRRALEAARAETDRPSLIVTRTSIGYGSPNRAGKSKAHGEALGAEEVKLAKEGQGWPLEPTFLVPQDVRDYLKHRSDAKRAERAAADLELAKWRETNAELAGAWDAARERRLPADLSTRLAADLDGVDNPTRKHAAVVLQRLVECAPYFIGGSADLAGSAAPPILKEQGVVGPGAAKSADPFAGTNNHFGIREHAMGAVSNGIALDGTLRPYCGTFLIFSDYMRPSIRLAALMGVPSVFVFTHDSIFLGEDGPTHQPIEQLDSLRAIPGLYVFRPADGIETAMAWSWIAQYQDGPAMLALSRQKLTALKRTASFEPAQVWKGAYSVEDSGDAPQLVLVATGSEVHLATEAAKLLRGDGVAVRVVSAPCLELFFEQDEAFQRSVIPDDGTPVVAIEAARGESLRRLLGRNGLICGIDRFGASAPFADLAEEFGFTAEQLAGRVRDHLRGVSS
jgi:transketolase